MTTIYTLVPALFNVFIVAIIILSIRKRFAGQAAKRTGSKKDSVNVNEFNKMVSHYNAVNNKTAVNLKSQESMTLKDDRSNDWMARQLRDEAIAMAKVSDMFKLKQSHMNNCDAEFIKRFHESNCDADGIDNGLKNKRR
jgi:hypothetical protein